MVVINIMIVNGFKRFFGLLNDKGNLEQVIFVNATMFKTCSSYIYLYKRALHIIYSIEAQGGPE